MCTRSIFLTFLYSKNVISVIDLSRIYKTGIYFENWKKKQRIISNVSSVRATLGSFNHNANSRINWCVWGWKKFPYIYGLSYIIIIIIIIHNMFKNTSAGSHNVLRITNVYILDVEISVSGFISNERKIERECRMACQKWNIP